LIFTFFKPLPAGYMERFFDEELNEVRTKLVHMSDLVVKNIKGAIQALTERNIELAKEVRLADDAVDEMNIWVDQHAVEHISLRAPVAGDVRLLYGAIKCSRDLERTGDEASSIAKRAKRIAKRGYSGDFYGMTELASKAISLLQESLDCWMRADADTARGIPKRDADVDVVYRSISKEINKILEQATTEAPSLVDLLFIAKSLERVGDHAANIAEEVVYLVTGEDIRYSEESSRK